MNRTMSVFAFALVAAGAACSKSDKPADSALNTDLSLAAQQRGFQPLDSVSAAERARANNLTGANAAAAPVAVAPRTAPVRHTASTTTHRSTGGSSGNGSSNGSSTVYQPAPEREVIVKHTQRDAAIGAVAGAVIGATTSGNKVKGGLIGGALGGILGGVIGNNVDKTKKKP
jgi:hypothetical protein